MEKSAPMTMKSLMKLLLNLTYLIKKHNSFKPRPHVSGEFCIRNFFYADTPSVHTCPPYTLGVSGDFCIRSPEWKFLYTLCIRIRVDARIRIFLHTLTSHVLKPQVNKQESREFGAKIIAGQARLSL